MHTLSLSGGAADARSYPDLLTLDDPAWRTVLDKASEVNAPAGTTLLESGESCAGFMLLQTGVVRVYEVSSDGRELFLYKVMPGDLCLLNLMFMFNTQPCHFKVIAETDVSILSINPGQFDLALNNSMRFRSSIFSAMAERVHHLMHMINNLAFHPLADRLLMRIHEKQQEQGSDLIHTTHQELASELGTSREVISRLLKNFESRVGAIKLKRGAIQILSTDVFQHSVNHGVNYAAPV